MNYSFMNSRIPLKILIIIFLIATSTAAQIIFGNRLIIIFYTTLLLLLFSLKFFESIVPVLSLLTFFDLTLGNFYSMPNFLIRELYLPIAFMAFCFHYSGKFGEIIKNIRNSSQGLLLSFFCLIVACYYISNPLLPANLLGIRSDYGGFRIYYSFFCNIVIFLIFFITISEKPKRLLSIEKYLFPILIIFCIIGLYFFFTKKVLDLPFFPQNQIYWTGLLTDGSFRIGFLQTFGVMLTFWGVVKINQKGTDKFYYGVIFILGIISIIASGGRSAMVGMVIGVVGLSFLLNLRKTINILIYSMVPLIIIFLGVWVIQPSQLLRLMSILGGTQQLDIGRKIIIDFYINSFKSSPIFGNGIGYKKDIMNQLPYIANMEYYFESQIVAGGHGAYFSILYVFGLTGGLPWFLLIINSIKSGIKSVIIFKKFLVISYWSQFSLSFLIFTLITFIVEGNGINKPSYFWCLGIIGGIHQYSKSLVQEEKIEK